MTALSRGAVILWFFLLGYYTKIWLPTFFYQWDHALVMHLYLSCLPWSWPMQVFSLFFRSYLMCPLNVSVSAYMRLRKQQQFNQMKQMLYDYMIILSDIASTPKKQNNRKMNTLFLAAKRDRTWKYRHVTMYLLIFIYI